MGYGVPAGIAAKMTYPDRAVVAVAGDGGFLMSAQELATAVAENVAIVVLVINNGLYGTIRMYQERNYPGRYPATTLLNPDIVSFARSFGAFAERVEETDAFAPALDRALDAGRAAVLDVVIDPEQITTRTTLSALRDEALRIMDRD
jgi:acetolactate synthase-1/2/3 large subunit